MINKISKEDQDLIERYISAYNIIEQFLRKDLNEDKEKGFKSLIAEYLYRYPRLKFMNDLKIFVDLRNSIIHGKTRPYEYLSVPLPDVVESLEKIKERLTNPERVIPKFQKNVTTIKGDESLFEILELVKQHNYSQFPVYENDTFQGLITENGITSWLASHMTDSSTTINFKEILIKDLLPRQERKKNSMFIAKETSVHQLINLFSDNLLLEAVLITHSGKSDQGLLGIVTVFDVMDLIDEY